MLPHAEEHYREANFIFQQNVSPAHAAKSTNTSFNVLGFIVLDSPMNSIDDLYDIMYRKKTPMLTMR